MTRRSTTMSTIASWLHFSGIIIVLCSLFALALVTMDARWENASLAPDAPSDAEKERQEIAVVVAQTNNLAHKLNQTATETATQQWLDTLGGVWVPWPNGAPRGYKNPPLNLQPETATPETLAANLQDISKKAVAARELDSMLATSIATGARQLATQLGGDYHDVCQTPDLPALAKHLSKTSSLATLETARQWYEHQAATTAERARAIEKVNLLTRLTENMIDSGAPDSRAALAPAEAAGTTPAQLVTATLIKHAENAPAKIREATAAFLCRISAGTTPEALPGLVVENSGK